MTGALRASRPSRAAGDPPLFLRELIEAAGAGIRVLDAGCGPGSWAYALRPDLRIVGCDVKFPPGPPPPAPHCAIFRGDLARLPIRDQAFDLTICHYVLEHVTELEPCCDELARVTRRAGTLYLSVPRSASFDDRLYRFARYFAKYVLFKWHKRLEHQQRFDLGKLLERFARRGFALAAHASVPAGFSWMNDPRTKPLQGPFTAALAWLHRTFGLDLARDANFVLAFHNTGVPSAAPTVRGAAALPGRRLVTHVCRECGEHAVIGREEPWPAEWICPWCGRKNPLGGARP